MLDNQRMNKANDEEPDDPIDQMLKKTGCIKFHYKVQVCSHDYC